MKFKIKVFRFNSSIDYNEYYESLDIDICEELHLLDLLNLISKSLNNFSYSNYPFALRINDIAVFSNLSLVDIYSNFGEKLEFSPISVKYAKHDLTIDIDEILNIYSHKLDRFDFLKNQDKDNFREFIPLNLISPIDDCDYVGDGYCLYIKQLCESYSEFAPLLLEEIAGEDGVFNSLKLENMIYPPSRQIDSEIEELQSILLKNPSQYALSSKILDHLESTLKNKFLQVKLGY